MENLLQHLENTNNTPTTQQQAWLESGRVLLRANKSTLKDEIAQLELQCAAIDRQCKQYTSVLSPMRRFPNEILLEIFTKFSASDHQSVLRTSQVCRRWREVIHDIHSLWTDVVIPLPSRHGEPTQYQIWEQVEHYALHAEGTPISLTIGNIPEDVVFSLLSEMFAEDCGLSVPVCYSNISIQTTKLFNCYLVFNHYETLGRDSSDLTSIAITARIFNDILDDGGVLDLTQFSELRAFRFDVRNSSSLDNRVLINWGVLTSLTLRSRKSGVEYLDIIAKCPSLETLDINPYYEDVVEGPVITLAKLRTLVITSDDPPITILERLSCPALEDATFTFADVTVRADLAITHFLERLSSRRLRGFQCSGDALPSFLGKRLFHIFSNLLSLKITAPFNLFVANGWTVFEELIQGGSHEWRFFEHLEEMEFQDHASLSPKDMTSCVAMIESHLAGRGSEARFEAESLTPRFVFTYTNPSVVREPANAIRTLIHYQETGVLSGLL